MFDYTTRKGNFNNNKRWFGSCLVIGIEIVIKIIYIYVIFFTIIFYILKVIEVYGYFIFCKVKLTLLTLIIG